MYRRVLSYAAIGSLLLLLVASAGARADVIYDDTVDPDLSNDHLNPTPLALPVGTSSIVLNTRLEDTGDVDVDLFRIELPPGGALAHLYLASFAGDSGASFIALQQGATMTFDPVNDPFACLTDCLGYAHIGPDKEFDGMAVGDDLLVGDYDYTGLDDSIAQGHFTPPLTGGPYTFWVQEFNGNVTMQLDFVVTPEPATAGLLAIGVLATLLGAARRRPRISR